MKRTAATLALVIASICGYAQNNLTFKLPSIPDTVRTIEGRFNYVVTNYWNNFNFSDTSYINARVTEEAVVNYIDLLTRRPQNEWEIQMHAFLSHTLAEVKMQNYINEVLRRYLVNYDSPMRNDKLYVIVAKYLSTNALDEITKFNAIQDTCLLSVNQIGNIATDFQFATPQGEQQRLSEIESTYTIMMFYKPDCKSCKIILDAVKQSEIINNSIKEGKLKLLAIYPQDDSYTWRNHLANLPDSWINGCDNGMELISEGIYDLRVLPVFYLLDSNKKIILKDVPFKTIEEFFME